MSRERQDDLPQDEFEDEEDALPAEPALDIAEAAPGALKAGIEVIQQFAKHLPNRPGVYRMFDRAVKIEPPGMKRHVGHDAEIEHRPVASQMLSRRQPLLFGTRGPAGEAARLSRRPRRRSRERVIARRPKVDEAIPLIHECRRDEIASLRSQ